MSTLRGDSRSVLTIWMGAAVLVRTVHLYAGDGNCPYYVPIYYYDVDSLDDGYDRNFPQYW